LGGPKCNRPFGSVMTSRRRDHLRPRRVAGVPDRGPADDHGHAGDVLFVPAGAVHAVRNVGGGNATELATYVVEKASRSSPWSSEGQPCGDGYPFLAGIGLDLRPVHRAYPRTHQRLVKPSWSATIDSSGTHVKEQPAGGRPRPPTPCRARVQPKRRFAPLEGYSLAGPGRCSPARAPVEWSGGRWSWLRGQTAGDPGHAARWSAPTSPRSGGRWLRSRRPNAIARDARAGGRRRSTGRYR
jgi:hypothetical protein